MTGKIIAIEEFEGPFKTLFDNIMRMVPEKDKDDIRLQRLLAFRLKINGESATREYLIGKIRDLVQCGYTGSFYDFLKDDVESKDCDIEDDPPDPSRA